MTDSRRQQSSGCRKAVASCSLLLAVGSLLIYVVGTSPAFQPPEPMVVDSEIQQLRWLAASDIPQLAETLDRRMVEIAAGNFIMGSDRGRDDERPQHLVYLDAFEIDRYEVTNAQYRRYLQATDRPAPRYWTGDTYPNGQADSPVVGVRWDDADAYCSWVGKRLPTEAEWEKACRGTDGRIYPWGDRWDPQRASVDVSPGTLNPLASDTSAWDVAWQLLRVTPTGPGTPGLQPIGSHPEGASPCGVMDLAGGASEWVADWYNWRDYTHMPVRNPIGLGPTWNHSVRGSAWHDPVGNATWVREMSRCSARSSSHEVSDPRVGFRCAQSVHEKNK